MVLFNCSMYSVVAGFASVGGVNMLSIGRFISRLNASLKGLNCEL